MAKTLEEKLRDKQIAHAVYIERYSGGLYKRIAADIKRKNAKIYAEIARRKLTTKSGVEALISAVGEIDKAFYTELKTKYMSEIAAFSASSQKYHLDIVSEEGEITLKALPNTEIKKIVSSMPVGNSPTMVSYFSNAQEYYTSATSAKISKLWNDGSSVGQIVDAVKGDKKELHNVETFVRTSIKAAEEATQAALYENNKDIVPKYEWVAVLDSRTSIICAQRDGKVFETGKGPIPPAHPRCRSTISPIFADGTRQGSGARYTASGKVAAGTTYAQWLKEQPEDVQNEVLGKTRADIFRKQKSASLKKFVTPTGEIKTLDELDKKRRQ